MQKAKNVDWAGVITVVVVFLVMGIALYLYYEQFVLNSQMTLSNNVNDWGVFGDYMGGIINPIVSFAALVFLYRAFILQRVELAETKNTLKQSSEEAKLQTKESVKQTDISIYTALINSSAAELQVKHTQLEQINEEIKHLAAVVNITITFSGRRVSADQETEEIEELSRKRECLEEEISDIRAKLDKYEELLSYRFNVIHGKAAGTLQAVTVSAEGRS